MSGSYMKRAVANQIEVLYMRPNVFRHQINQNSGGRYALHHHDTPLSRIGKKYPYTKYFSTQESDSDHAFELAQMLDLNSHTVTEPKLPQNVVGRRRRLDIAIVGLPNAGKSQLLNVITGSSISAVSRKRHTTRQGITAAKTITKHDKEGKATTTQLLFVDTPGFVDTGSSINGSRNRSTKNIEKLDRDLMISEARREMVAVDYTVIVLDAARRFTPDVRAATVELMMMALASQGRIEEFQEDKKDSIDETEATGGESSKDGEEVEVMLPHQKFAVVLNKVDLIYPKSSLLAYAFELGAIAQECLQYRPARQLPDGSMSESTTVPMDESTLVEVMPTFFYISALENDGVDDLLNFLLEKSTPANVFEMEPGTATNQSPEERSEEIIREKVYRCLHKELPYQIQQRNRTFKVTKDKESGKLGLYIEQDLLVASKTHQELVRGRGSRTLERIRETAEFTMKLMFKCDVTLKLEVKFVKSKNQRNDM